MAYPHSLIPRDASVPHSVSATSALPVPVPDGAWFRRERERIAVGRRAIAHQLQVAESRVVALETRRQPVPGPWLPLLGALGFRLPSASAEFAAPASDLKPAVPRVQVDAPAAALSGEPQASAGATVLGECAAAVAPRLSAAAVKTPEPPAEVRAGEPPAAAAQSADLTAAAAPAAPVSPSIAPPVAESFLPGEPAPDAAAPSDAAPLPAARPADTARSPAAPPRPHLSAEGGWLQAERERLGLSRNSVRQLLNIQWATYAKIERQKLPVPQRWWRKLKEVGFRFPGKPAPPPAPSVPAPPPAALQGGLRGTWLRRQRQRLGLSEQDLWKALQVHWRTFTAVERHNRLIPAAWLPTLERLGMTAAGRPEAASEPRPRRAPAVSPPAAPAAPPAAAAAPDQPDGDDLLSMIVKYRLALGRRSRQSAVEIMALIAHDLRTADLSQAITHDQLAAAMQSLLRSRSSAA